MADSISQGQGDVTQLSFSVFSNASRVALLPNDVTYPRMIVIWEEFLSVLQREPSLEGEKGEHLTALSCLSVVVDPGRIGRPMEMADGLGFLRYQPCSVVRRF